MVLKIRAAIAQPLQVPAGIAIWPEEQHAHVVVNTVDTPSKLVKISNALRTDQARCSRDKNRFHFHITVSIVGSRSCVSPVSHELHQHYGQPSPDDLLPQQPSLYPLQGV